MGFLSRARYLALIGVLFSLLAAAGAFIAGAWKTVDLLRLLVAGSSHDHGVSVGLVQLMDSFLIGAGLLIFGLSLYELFIGKLELPPALEVGDLSDLKGKLATIIVLVLAVGFLEHFVDWENGHEVLLHGIAASLISAVLIALSTLNKSH